MSPDPVAPLTTEDLDRVWLLVVGDRQVDPEVLHQYLTDPLVHACVHVVRQVAKLTGVRWCYIDGCHKPATLRLHTHPDMTLLCDDHRSLHAPDEWDPPDEPCRWPKPCELCDLLDGSWS